jgi:hypothetical protein
MKVLASERTSEDEESVDAAAVAEEDVGVQAVAHHQHLGLVQLVPARGKVGHISQRLISYAGQGRFGLLLDDCIEHGSLGLADDDRLAPGGVHQPSRRRASTCTHTHTADGDRQELALITNFHHSG